MKLLKHLLPQPSPLPLEESSWDPGTCDFMNQLDSKYWMFNKYSKWYSSWEEKSIWIKVCIESVQFICSVVSDSVTPMDCSVPGFHVHHQLPELAQTYLHQVSDAIQPSHPLSSASPFNLSQHQGLFQGVSSLHQMAKVLEFQLQISPSTEHSGLISFRIDCDESSSCKLWYAVRIWVDDTLCMENLSKDLKARMIRGLGVKGLSLGALEKCWARAYYDERYVLILFAECFGLWKLAKR